MRVGATIFVIMAISGTGAALAQSAPSNPERAGSASQEAPDEVVVRGRRIGELRAEVETARERAYTIFNEINTNNDFDVSCHNERQYHSRTTHRVCRPQFENRISAGAAKEYLSSLFLNCPPELGAGVTQDCIFSDQSQGAISSAQAIEGELPTKQDQMTEEIFRLARENDEFARAILDWYEASKQYDAARKRTND
jgi:hypothetical protein